MPRVQLMDNPNETHLRSCGGNGEFIDWSRFYEAQKPHQEAMDAMDREFRRRYWAAETAEERMTAGDALDYSRARIWLHEKRIQLAGFFKSDFLRRAVKYYF